MTSPAPGPDDTDVGRHADVVECEGRAFIFYFTHPELDSALDKDGYQARRSVVLAAELDGRGRSPGLGQARHAAVRAVPPRPLAAPQAGEHRKQDLKRKAHMSRPPVIT